MSVEVQRSTALSQLFEKQYRVCMFNPMMRAIKEANRSARGSTTLFEWYLVKVDYEFGENQQSMAEVNTAISNLLQDIIDRLPGCKVYHGTVHTNWLLDEATLTWKLSIMVRLIRDI